MKVRHRILTSKEILLCTLVFSVFTLGVPAFAEDKPAVSAAAPGQDETMKAWMAMATPGEAHKKLDALAGSWTSGTKMWMDPANSPETTTGTAEGKWVLGGRFLEQRAEGTYMGQPFSGLGYVGYDKYKKKYVGTWMDTTTTMIVNSTGTADASGRVFKSWSTIDDPFLKKPVKLRSVTKVVDADHLTYEMWGPGPDGKVYKMFEIHYTRKK
jgi:uncharacterized protein DUF1579